MYTIPQCGYNIKYTYGTERRQVAGYNHRTSEKVLSLGTGYLPVL